MVNKIQVKATSYKIKGTKGSISFKWKTNLPINPENEKEIVKRIETIIGVEFLKQKL
ncbi:hypothetical protein [Polaribacter aestuariivivens]|uniref:hypothetical protein n=1 Tax=Polaribacter aestuariivivens TaxID=2304626 RepID=UPI003F49ACF1